MHLGAGVVGSREILSGAANEHSFHYASRAHSAPSGGTRSIEIVALEAELSMIARAARCDLCIRDPESRVLILERPRSKMS